MKQRFRLHRRKGGIYYIHDSEAGKQTSFVARDRAEVTALLVTRTQAHRQAHLNLQLACTYLAATDPMVAKRTWQVPMEKLAKTKRGATDERWQYVIRDKAFDLIRNLPILETQAEHFLKVLQVGTISTNVFLRRIHNFALDVGWLPWPVSVKRQWPGIRFQEKRAITHAEHLAILERERNPEWRAFYALLWHLGGAQSDVATLRAEDVDWSQRIVSYSRKKTGTISHLHFEDEVEAILASRPSVGPLFPEIALMHEKHRAKLFRRRCGGGGVRGGTEAGASKRTDP